MTPAFVAATPLGLSPLSTSSACSFTPRLSPATAPQAAVATASPTITMRCRRDLKKEKSLRNMEFARIHRKRVVRRFNRRAAQEATQNADNEYLSSIYGTMRFGSNEGEDLRS